MKNVIVEYGPPGVRGVSQIMGLGTDSLEVVEIGPAVPFPTPADVTIRIVGACVGAWILGSFIGSNTIKNMAVGGAVASIVTHRLAK